MDFFSVRSVIQFNEDMFEERVTLWRAGSFEEALRYAETESREYAELVNGQYLRLAQAFHLSDSPESQGAEIFSLIRRSALSPTAYLSRHFDTGLEHQGHLEGEDRPQ